MHILFSKELPLHIQITMRMIRNWLDFKNNAPFISCPSKINDTLIDNPKDLDIVTPMYNFIEYSKNYSKTTGRLWNHYRDETNSGAVRDVWETSNH